MDFNKEQIISWTKQAPSPELREVVLECIVQMPMLEISELVKDLEKKFGVTAAAAVPVMAGPTAGAATAGGPAPAAEEKTEFSVVLSAVGNEKIKVIKVVREVTNLGLKEAKDLVEGAPKTVKEGVSKEEAETIKKKFAEVGATADIK